MSLPHPSTPTAALATAPAATPVASPVQVVPVTDRRGLDRFLRVPFRIQGDDPRWVPPLFLERLDSLSPRTNPFFRNAEVAYWTARRDGMDVGRISAQVDRRGLAHRGDTTGHFGLLVGEDDPAVFQALLATAEAWLKARGMTRIEGPFNLWIYEELGLLVDGFDTPPMLLMGHDPAYAGHRLERLGYGKAKDLYAYLYDIRVDVPKSVRALIDRKVPGNVTLRPLDLARYGEEVRTIVDIFNDAWSSHWGFVPMDAAVTAHMANSLRPLIVRDLVQFVEVDGEPAAFGVCLPNLNAAIHDLNGKLLPFGWAKLLWRLKVAGVKTARVPLMGVKRKFAQGLLGSLLPFLVIDALRRKALARGIEQVELSWILEDNLPMRRINEALGSVAYKTYRIYGRDLP